MKDTEFFTSLKILFIKTQQYTTNLMKMLYLYSITVSKTLLSPVIMEKVFLPSRFVLCIEDRQGSYYHAQVDFKLPSLSEPS